LLQQFKEVVESLWESRGGSSGVGSDQGGAPVLLGSMLGYQVDSETLSLLFYALSAGAILYVIGEIWNAMRRLGHRELGLVMISAGVFLGVATEMIIAYGGLGQHKPADRRGFHPAFI
jgi:hypothetical protein